MKKYKVDIRVELNELEIEAENEEEAEEEAWAMFSKYWGTSGQGDIDIREVEE